MRYPEAEIVEILKASNVDFTSSLPCEKIKNLLEQVKGNFFHVPLTREEEGVGISAGAALSGRKPAMFVQSSGIGNMLNALLSLTCFYQFPLALFVSHRGIYKEKIAAQIPMGQGLPRILAGAGIAYSIIDSRNDLTIIEKKLLELYAEDAIHAFLLSPAVWEEICEREDPSPEAHTCAASGRARAQRRARKKARWRRFEILETIAPHLDSKVVVCNLGFPAKELFHIRHQPSNFYMLGSMGMATPIGLGIALSKDKDVIVIDGDGSLLMNPGTLATAAHFSPANLTILAIDNSVYGSTGNQPTLAGSCADLELLAQGFGIGHTVKVTGKNELRDILKRPSGKLTFIHILAHPGNADVPNISLHHLDNKSEVESFLRKS